MPDAISLHPDVFAKCLADATRARVLLLITQEGELCVCELMYALDLNQPKVSRHLALLRSQELLADRRQGQWVYYRLHPSLPPWVEQTLRIVGSANQSWFGDDIARLRQMPNRPQRCC